MEWEKFVDVCFDSLKIESEYFDFEKPFSREQELTRHLVFGLRKLYAVSFGLDTDSDELHYKVIYRQGDSKHDKIAWKDSKNQKWIKFHGIFFVPDILIFHEDNVLPFEIKLIKKKTSNQAIQTSIGQSLIYSSIFGKAFAFIGIKQNIEWGRYELRAAVEQEDEILYKKLKQNNIRLIFKEVF